jgi:hypothetical protein
MNIGLPSSFSSTGETLNYETLQVFVKTFNKIIVIFTLLSSFTFKIGSEYFYCTLPISKYIIILFLQIGGFYSVLLRDGQSPLPPYVPGFWQSGGHSPCRSGFLCKIQVSFQYVRRLCPN